MSRTAKQLLREFWLPTLVAVGWAVVNLRGASERSVTTFVNIAAPSFFFASWLTAQYFWRRLKPESVM